MAFKIIRNQFKLFGCHLIYGKDLNLRGNLAATSIWIAKLSNSSSQNSSVTSTDKYIDYDTNCSSKFKYFSRLSSAIIGIGPRNTEYGKYNKKNDQKYEFFRVKVTKNGFKHQFVLEKYQERSSICDILKAELLSLDLITNSSNYKKITAESVQNDSKQTDDGIKNDDMQCNDCNPTTPTITPTTTVTPTTKCDIINGNDSADSNCTKSCEKLESNLNSSTTNCGSSVISMESTKLLSDSSNNYNKCGCDCESLENSGSSTICDNDSTGKVLKSSSKFMFSWMKLK